MYSLQNQCAQKIGVSPLLPCDRLISNQSTSAAAALLEVQIETTLECNSVQVHYRKNIYILVIFNNLLTKCIYINVLMKKKILF